VRREGERGGLVEKPSGVFRTESWVLESVTCAPLVNASRVDGGYLRQTQVGERDCLSTATCALGGRDRRHGLECAGD
jgi:hypothetical protein